MPDLDTDEHGRFVDHLKAFEIDLETLECPLCHMNGFENYVSGLQSLTPFVTHEQASPRLKVGVKMETKATIEHVFRARFPTPKNITINALYHCL